MTNDPQQIKAPALTPPVIPPPPPGGGKPRKRKTDRGLLIWLGAFVLGIGLGIAAYQWIQPIASFFDFTISMVF